MILWVFQNYLVCNLPVSGVVSRGQTTISAQGVLAKRDYVWRINKNWPAFQNPSNIPLYSSHELSHGTLGSINHDLSRRVNCEVECLSFEAVLWHLI